MLSYPLGPFGSPSYAVLDIMSRDSSADRAFEFAMLPDTKTLRQFA